MWAIGCGLSVESPTGFLILCGTNYSRISSPSVIGIHEVSAGGGYFKTDGTNIGTYTPTAIDVNYKGFIFASGKTDDHQPYRAYEAYIGELIINTTQGDNLHLIPFRRNNLFSMIDIVTNSLLENQGSGTFTEKFYLPDGTEWTPGT